MLKLQMNNQTKYSKIIFVLIVGIFLITTGCLPKTGSEEPTPDLNLIRTEIAKTVVAEITVQAALNPTSEPTQEPVPPTAIPTLVPTATATETQIPLAQENTATPLPTATHIPTTKAPANNSSSVEKPPPPYQCHIVRQAPGYGYEITPGGNFDITWAVRNSGTATWDPQTFDFVYLKGDKFHKFADRQDLTNVVEQGDIHDFFVNMVAPNQPGLYQTWWSLVDGHQTPVCILYLSINVVE